MKINVRKGVFETNSSSTHSLTICSKEEYEKWANGEYIFDDLKEKFYEKGSPETTEADEEDLMTHEQFFEDYDLETFKHEYKTKSGDEVVVFGKFGFDG